jgi:N-acetylmuramoyl-L-alanine amidase
MLSFKEISRFCITFIATLFSNLSKAQAEITGATVEQPVSIPDKSIIPEPEQVEPKIKVYLDPGHHAGIVSNRSPEDDEGQIFYEWESNLRFARDIQKAAESAGFPTLITFPDAEVVTNSKETLSQFSQRVYTVLNDDTSLVKVFLSLHSNADGSTGVNVWGTASGLEIFIHPQIFEPSKRAAMMMTDALLRTLQHDTRDRSFKQGFKTDRDLYVLRKLTKARITAMLIEFEFHDSKVGLKRLKDSSWRARAVAGVIEGLKSINRWA